MARRDKLRKANAKRRRRMERDQLLARLPEVTVGRSVQRERRVREWGRGLVVVVLGGDGGEKCTEREVVLGVMMVVVVVMV